MRTVSHSQKVFDPCTYILAVINNARWFERGAPVKNQVCRSYAVNYIYSAVTSSPVCLLVDLWPPGGYTRRRRSPAAVHSAERREVVEFDFEQVARRCERLVGSIFRHGKAAQL